MTSIDTAICYLTVRNWITSLLDRLMPRRRYHGHHAEPFLDDQWADDINGDVIEYAAVAGHPPWEVHHERPVAVLSRAVEAVPDKLDQLAALYQGRTDEPVELGDMYLKIRRWIARLTVAQGVLA